MNRSNLILSILFFTVLSASACSGPKPGTVCAACGAGEGTIALTMVADTLPTHPSLLTFQITITSITFTPSSGTPTTVNLSPALTVDLMRLQSDTVFLGTFAKIPAAQYTSVTVTISNGSITFLNDTNTTLSSCPPSTICPLSLAAGNPAATFTYTVSQNAVTGIGLDLDYLNTVTISGSTLAANFSNTNVLSAFALPRTGSSLASGQLDHIEDFTGVVSLGNPVVTITSASVTGRGALTASTSSATNYDPDPSGTLCRPGTTQLTSCVSSNQAASMDVVLNSDGTLSVQEIEPLSATLKDTVEGIVVGVNSGSQTQFTIIVTDLIPAAQNSLIANLSIGSGLTVNIPNPNPFLVDTKGLQVQNNFGGNFSSFFGQTNTSAIHLGQTVAVHVTGFTAAVANTIVSCTSDTVTLRWSRFTAATSTNSSPAFSIAGFPAYFNASGVASVESFTGTLGADGITHLDGVPTTTNLVVNNPVAVRALFIENSGDTLVPAFFAAKVRQH